MSSNYKEKNSLTETMEGVLSFNWSRTLSRDVSNFQTLFYGLNFRGDEAPYRIDENEELGHNGRGIYSDV